MRPNIECWLGRSVMFQGIWTCIARKPYFFFREGPHPLLPPPGPRLKDEVNALSTCLTLFILEPCKQLQIHQVSSFLRNSDVHDEMKWKKIKQIFTTEMHHCLEVSTVETSKQQLRMTNAQLHTYPINMYGIIHKIKRDITDTWWKTISLIL